MHNLAILMHKLKRFMEAEKLYKQALAVRSEHLGDEHPDTVATNNNLETLNADKIRLGSRLSRLNTAARGSAIDQRATTHWATRLELTS